MAGFGILMFIVACVLGLAGGGAWGFIVPCFIGLICLTAAEEDRELARLEEADREAERIRKLLVPRLPPPPERDEAYWDEQMRRLEMEEGR
jgi:hypothetical protein